MRFHVHCSALCLMAIVTLFCHATNAEQDVDQKDTAITSDRDGKLFKFVVRSTTTSFAIVRSTSTVAYTCLMTAADTVCAGRKKRKRRTLSKVAEPLVDSGNVPHLHSSVQDAPNTDTALKKEDRIIITSWSTRITTFTSISTVTTFGSTVLLSALCTLGGISAFPAC